MLICNACLCTNGVWKLCKSLSTQTFYNFYRSIEKKHDRKMRIVATRSNHIIQNVYTVLISFYRLCFYLIESFYLCCLDRRFLIATYIFVLFYEAFGCLWKLLSIFPAFNSLNRMSAIVAGCLLQSYYSYNCIRLTQTYKQ